MRLISDNPAPTAPNLILSIEESTVRLREALAILEMIDGEALLAELPEGPNRDRHQCAVSLLNVLRREIQAVTQHQLDLLDAFGCG